MREIGAAAIPEYWCANKDEQATCDELLQAQEYYRWDRTIE
jgi:hypothetical protein